VKVNGNAVNSGTASAAINLVVGDNALTIVVKAEDGITTRTYTVTVNRSAVESGFDPDVDGEVRSLALRPDGKILLAGKFTTVGGVVRSRVAQLNADGTLDTG